MKSLFFCLVLLLSPQVFSGEMGLWKTKCVDLGDDSILVSSLNIRGQRWFVEHTAFEDTQCSKAWLKHQLSYKVLQRGHDLDMTLIQASYEALTAETVEALNLVSYCGFSDWKVNSPKVVLGRECQDYRVPQSGQILYSTFLMINSENKPAILLGVGKDTLDGSSPEKRHQEYSETPYFKD